MNILLVNPTYFDRGRIIGPSKINILLHNYCPPMGLLYLKSYLKQKSDFPVRLWNGEVPERPGEKELIAAVEQFQPDLVGITVNTLKWYDAWACAKLVKAIRPETHVVMGGSHLLIYPEETLAQPQIDTIVIGDGEDALLELATRLSRNQGLEGIPGLWFKKEGKIIRNPPRPPEKNLDRLPFPDRSDLSLTQHRFAADRLSPAAIMVTARGCPFSCTFCCTVDRVHRKRSAQNIVDEMLFCREMGYKWIDFWDDVFNISKPVIMELCNEIIRRQVHLPWSCRGRVSPFDEEMAAKMAEAGCERINLGVESASQEILDRTKKGITVEQCRQAFALAKKYHIATVGFFMIGFPGETREQALQTIRFMMELDPDFVSLLSLYPLPGSEIYEQAIKDPNFFGDYAREYARNPTPGFIWRTWITTISEPELNALLRRGNLGFYFRPRYLWRSFRRLSSLEDFYAKAKMALVILTA